MSTARNKNSDSAWQITETQLNAEALEKNATLFSQANGTLGLRGDFEEGFGESTPQGVFLNGFYESAPIVYGEKAFGYAKNSQTIVPPADARRISLVIDGEKLDLSTGMLLSYHRALCMRDGTLRRSFRWRSPKGQVVAYESTRLVLREGSCGVQRLRVTIEQPFSQLELSAFIDSSAPPPLETDDPRVAVQSVEGLLPVKTGSNKSGYYLSQRTRRSGLGCCAAACADAVLNGQPLCGTSAKTDGQTGMAYTLSNGDAGTDIELTQYFSYAYGNAADLEQITARAQAESAAAHKRGFEALLEETQADWAAFWNRTGLSITGDNNALQGLRFCVFQLRSSAADNGHTGIAAKGLSGSGYEGHFFWDSETFMFPFFLYNQPSTARALLDFRYNTLPAARDRARELGYFAGALYPWRTINGEECSAYYPAGTAQYHINADIANAIGQYADATEDFSWMRERGLEILVETARFWMGLGFFNKQKDGAFCIHCVTGPDEYSALVNNNTYTNLMAAHNLRLAASWFARLKKLFPAETIALAARLALTTREAAAWKRAANKMYYPKRADGLPLQDEEFDNRKSLDFARLPKEKFPLLLHFHPLEIYRHKVCKQADLVLALFLRGEHFSQEEKQAAFDYYEPFTTHDSSLSRAVFGIVAGEIGRHQTARDYFSRTLRLDLDDIQGNVRDGLHLANLGGAWMGMAYGFGGMRDSSGTLSFAPFLPRGFRGYRFCVSLRGCRLSVCVTPGTVTYELKEGAALRFLHHSRPVTLKSGAKKTLDLD